MTAVTVHWQVGAHTERGARRGTNMDALLVAPHSGLVVLADGMGSTKRGGEAAAMAVAVFAERLGVQDRDEDGVNAAVAAVQDQLVAEFAAGGLLTGATTLCALVAAGDGLLVVNVGDSRAHLLHDGVLQVLTTDHTVAAHLVAVGAAEPDSPLVRRTTNHLRRYLGNPAGASADITRLRPVPGDTVLLSTDGVHGALNTAQMADILAGSRDPELGARRLVVAAAAAGGTDDASAVVVRPQR
ncbi:MAG: PP2C family protein-serine/threonine phosphatase [Mycobacteriales bacterium]